MRSDFSFKKKYYYYRATNKKNGFGPVSYKFFVPIRVGLTIFLFPNKKNGFGPFSYKFFVPIFFFLTKKTKKQKIKMPNGWKTIKSLVHKIRLHGRRGKGMAESFSREKLRHAPQKEGG